jgi:hypothetical protein
VVQRIDELTETEEIDTPTLERLCLLSDKYKLDKEQSVSQMDELDKTFNILEVIETDLLKDRKVDKF